MSPAAPAGGGRLDRRVAAVTGAGRGIGAATAERFAREGAALVLADRDEEPLESTARAVARYGMPVLTVPGDVSAPDVAARVAGRAVGELGGLDVVVNNAGWHHHAAFHALDAADWEAVDSAVYGATVAACRACVPRLRELAGAELAEAGQVSRVRKIVNTAAAAFLTGEPGDAPLAAAAGAVVGLTRVLARELGGFGVTVNAVVPGFVATRLTESEPPAAGGPGVAEPVRQLTKATTALGRVGEPADLAGVHAFLASDDADFVTGATIPVTGGLLGTFA